MGATRSEGDDGEPISGKFSLKFTIGPRGEVLEASICEDSFQNAALADCIVRAAKTWKFDEPKGGGVVNVTYPWVCN